MSSTTVTYEREMTMTYGSTNLSRGKRAKMNTLLYEEGLCLHGDYGRIFEQSRFGMVETEATKKIVEITVSHIPDVPSRTYTESDRDIIAGWHRAVDALLLTDEVEFATIETITTKTHEQEPQGSHLVFGGDNTSEELDKMSNGSNLMVIGDTGVTMKVDMYMGIYRPPALTFLISWEAPSVQKSGEIQSQLVEVPLKFMGQISAAVERCLIHNGIETDEPMIDCEFRSLNESRSECAPDIIEMVRAEKRKHL